MSTLSAAIGDTPDAARGKETSDMQSLQMLKQSLTDEIKLAVKELRGLYRNYVTKIEEFEAETKGRGEELQALATAKKIVKEATGAALDQESFLQISKISSRTDLANFEVTRMIRDLAKKDKSAALAQLASRVASTVRFGGANQADVFAKVKGLIHDMISKLESEVEADAIEKAFCDKELAETNLKKDDKTAEIEKLSAKIDKQKSQSAQLKEQVATLQAEPNSQRHRLRWIKYALKRRLCSRSPLLRQRRPSKV